MVEINVQEEVKAILLDLEFLKECQQTVVDVIKSYFMNDEEAPKPKYHKGQEVRFILDPDLLYQVKDIILKRHGFAYSISPIEEMNVTLVAIDENLISLK